MLTLLQVFEALGRRLRASARLRAACVAAVVLTITALAAGNPGWAGPAQAQTVPTITKSPTAGAPPATASPTVPAPPSATAAASATPGPTATPRPTLPPPRPTSTAPTATLPPGCAAAPRGVAAIGPGRRAQLTLRQARFTLLLTQRPVTPGANAAQLCWITITGAPSAALPPLPTGWTALTRGLRLAASGPAGQPLMTPVRGLLACFRLANRNPAGAEIRVAALGQPPAASTWSLLPTRRLGDQACAPIAALPATLLLISRAAP